MVAGMRRCRQCHGTPAAQPLKVFYTAKSVFNVNVRLSEFLSSGSRWRCKNKSCSRWLQCASHPWDGPRHSRRYKHWAALAAARDKPSFCYSSPLNPPPQLAPLRKEQVRTTSTLCKDELHLLLLLLFVSAALSVFLHPPSAFTRYFFDFLRGFFCEGNPSEWDNAA